MKKIVLIITTMLMTSLVYSAVQDLQNTEKGLYSTLSEFWIDKSGDTHVGNKDPKELQFAFSETLMPRLTIKQIVDSMGAAIAKFDQAKKDAFAAAVEPYLKELTDIRLELKRMRDQLDTYAGTLGQYLQKTPQDIMKMADTNIRNLISKLPNDKKIEVGTKVKLAEFNNLRIAFGIQTTETPITPARPGAAGAEAAAGAPVSTAGAKITAAANAIAQSETKLAGLVKASATIAQQTPCKDIHFDIVPSETGTGVLFLRLVK